MHSLLGNAQLLVLAPALLVAAIHDLRTRTIRNRLVLLIAIAGLATQAATGGWQGLATGVSAAALGFLCLLPLYLTKGMAGGDVKLMAATGTWLTVPLALAATGAALVVGALVAVFHLLLRRPERGIAYAPAIALGTFGALWWQ
jgi:prepilin peptidase CpaA